MELFPTTTFRGNLWGVEKAKFIKDDKEIISAGHDGSIRIFDLSNNE